MESIDTAMLVACGFLGVAFVVVCIWGIVECWLLERDVKRFFDWLKKQLVIAALIAAGPVPGTCGAATFFGGGTCLP